MFLLGSVNPTDDILSGKPTFLLKPEDLEVIEDEVCSFKAIVAGKPMPVVEWCVYDAFLGTLARFYLLLLACQFVCVCMCVCLSVCVCVCYFRSHKSKWRYCEICAS